MKSLSASVNELPFPCRMVDVKDGSVEVTLVAPGSVTQDALKEADWPRCLNERVLHAHPDVLCADPLQEDECFMNGYVVRVFSLPEKNDECPVTIPFRIAHPLKDAVQYKSKQTKDESGRHRPGFSSFAKSSLSVSVSLSLSSLSVILCAI